MISAFVWHKNPINPQIPHLLGNGDWKVILSIGTSEHDAEAYMSHPAFLVPMREWQANPHINSPFHWGEFEEDGKTFVFVADTKGLDRGYPCLRIMCCVYDTQHTREEAKAWWDQWVSDLPQFC